MKIAGNLLKLLSLLLVITGIAAGFVTYQSVMEAYENIDKAREKFTQRIDEVKTLFSDVEVIYGQSNKLIKQYESGEFNSLEDDRIKAHALEIKKLADAALEVKTEVEGDIKEVEALGQEMQTKYQATIIVAMVSVISLILSGWIFSLGVMLSCSRKK